jgi:hypothetical protein
MPSFLKQWGGNKVAKAIARFSAKVARPPADEPDAVTIEVIAAALKGSSLSGSGKNHSPFVNFAEHTHGHSSELVHPAIAAATPRLAPRPRSSHRRGTS